MVKTSNSEPASVQSCQHQILNLHRLLYCMTNVDNLDEVKLKTDEIRREQIYLARSMLATLENSLHDFLQFGREEKATVEIVRIVEVLKKEVESACRLVNDNIVDQVQDQADVFDQIFMDESSSISDRDEIDDDDLSAYSKREIEEEWEDVNTTPTKSNKINVIATETMIPSHKLTSEEQYKEQEENLKNEIADLASQLKKSTMEINSTLSFQNVELNEMEGLAEININQTMAVTGKVTDHVKTGWRQTVGRWVTFFVILGSWAFCFLTMKVVSKREDTCIFFCGNTKRGRNYERTSASDQWSEKTGADQTQQQNQEGTINERAIPPKYSYCEAQGCSIPRSHQEHTMSMHRSDHMKLDGINIAYDILEEHLEKRNKDKLIFAQEESDDIGLKRVRDGWRQEFTYTLKDLSVAARFNKVSILSTILQHKPQWANYRDSNGWEALHEAVRGGHLDSVELLVETGEVDVNSRVGYHRNGGSPVYLANKLSFPADHPIILYLESRGAHSIPPDSSNVHHKIVPEDNIVTKEFDVSSVGEISEHEAIDIDANIDWADDINDTTDYYYDNYSYDDDNSVDDAKIDEEYETPHDTNVEVSDKADRENIADLSKTNVGKDDSTLGTPRGKVSPSDIDADDNNDSIINDSNSVTSDDNENLDESPIDGVNKDEDSAYEPHDILTAARTNDIITLTSILRDKPEWVSIKDVNGWQALHEATRNSHIDAVEMLVEMGHADVNSRTGKDMNGGSALWWVTEAFSFPADSTIVTYLLTRGAQVIPPDTDPHL